MPVAAVALVFVMLVPLPGFALDLLLAISITASVLVLLSAVHILRPVQFSVFPSLLLLLTLFRLALNLASSRRILLHGNEGASAAGHVIEAFGQFVVGGNYVVGFVLFLALIAIQYMVVSHGAVRTAEVTARFTLDAMPGKQMAIDADLNAGLIDEKQARARREAVAREAEFYGAMDGAARFSQRDSLATILITAINIIAGFLIGVFQLDIPFREALKTYTILTVGDGLVTMIPVAAGLRGRRHRRHPHFVGQDLGADVGKQPSRAAGRSGLRPGSCCALALIPGLPKLSFLLMAVAAGWLAWRAKSRNVEKPPPAAQPGAAHGTTGAGIPSRKLWKACSSWTTSAWRSAMRLVPLVDAKQGGQFLQRVQALRRHLALQLGFIVPPVHITDNLLLKPREYVIFLRGVEIARWEMRDDCLLAISSEREPPAVPGFRRSEPAFGVSARWIVPGLREQALAAGYAVVDQTSVIATHLAEVIKQHAYELLSRQETKRLLDRLAESPSQAVRGTGPQVTEPGRSAEGAAATAARAGFDSRSPHHSGKPAGYGRGSQESGVAGGSRPPGAGTGAGASAAQSRMAGCGW